MKATEQIMTRHLSAKNILHQGLKRLQTQEGIKGMVTFVINHINIQKMEITDSKVLETMMTEIK